MRLVIQRVKKADVRVGQETIGQIEKGLLVFVGIFNTDTKENADKIKEQYPSSIVVQDEDYYRVYVGVSAGDDWTHSLEKYFLENNVNVYPKEIQVTNTFYEELNQYKTLFSNSDASVYERLNGEIMKKIEGEIR